ncbi:hypothetical protein [Burkholderia sp. Tr-849]|uniref:hypothetical protein n=1 Tax=Burkholderia sp. Tr-849 TaxID=2608330 RepID=UPI001F03EBB9|nr:hypothetical protein [Burkholderia sp. Tr-849]
MDTIRPLNEARQQIQQSLFDLLKGLSFSERLAQGGLMALHAVCGPSRAYVLGRALDTEQAVWSAITATSVPQHTYSYTLGAAVGGGAGAALGGNMSRSSYERDYGGRGDRGYRHRKHHHHRDWD